MFKNKKTIIFLFAFLIMFSFFSFDSVLASDPFGVEKVNEEIVLEASDPRSMASRIINIALAFLSIIAVSLVIYAGFLWMTSEGNEEKVSKAKRILKNALIGLIIILAAWGIVSFIFKNLASDDSSGTGPGSFNNFFQQGSGAMGNCSLESVYPSPGQEDVPRNTNIMITFKEEVASTTLNTSTVVICEEDDFDMEDGDCSGDQADFNLSTTDDKIFVLSLTQYLGSEDGFTNYVVYLKDEIEKIDRSESIFETCSPQYYTWGFEVSDELDLDPPQVDSVFPGPDDDQDEVSSTSASYATGSIEVTGEPDYFQEAEVLDIIPGTNIDSVDVDIDSHYDAEYTELKIVVLPNENQVQLFTAGGDDSAGVFDIVDNEIDFSNFFDSEFIVNIDSVTAGDSWDIKIQPMTSPDTIEISSDVYTFVNEAINGYNIEVDTADNTTAQNIAIALNGNSNVDASYNENTTVMLKASTGGSSGNDIHLSSSSENIEIEGFSGGIDFSQNFTVKDKPDQPMNSIIQINFNEAVNPIMVSGHSSEVEEYIKVVDMDQGDATVTGTFSISSDYTTVEFQSDDKCGVNACGEDIFCLPANSNLRVELVAADLEECTDDTDCSNLGAFSKCNGFCSYPGDSSKGYPVAKMSFPEMPFNGIVDAVGNSLDGNADGFACGPGIYEPASFYDLNEENSDSGDNLEWSFWINNVIETEPPKIEGIYPEYSTTSVDLLNPVEVEFNKLMMTSSLRTGNTDIGGVDHPLMNLIGSQAVGYWISSENIDTSTNGVVDETNSFINHAEFYELASYTAQVGSGIRDIYQNCFKPSAGLDCEPTIGEPFCCNGNPSDGPCD